MEKLNFIRLDFTTSVNQGGHLFGYEVHITSLDFLVITLEVQKGCARTVISLGYNILQIVKDRSFSDTFIS